MLEPNNRLALLEALRPPEGYMLDFAMGTTYSLDLPALLMVPLSFTFFDIQDKEEGPVSDPVALLEAIRRNADRIAVFVQAGQIKIPVNRNQLLYAELEKSIHTVQPPEENAIFHPKFWVIRFIQGKEIMYRLLCSSRNLTFDRSWDTLLCTEGPLTQRVRVFTKLHGLGDLISELPKLAQHDLSPQLAHRIRQFEYEIRRTDFEVPEGFEKLHTWSPGVVGNAGFCIDELPKRLLVVSPFVDDKLLPALTRDAREAILISREEELRKLSSSTLNKFTKVFFLNHEADTHEAVEDDATEELDGLHAKLFIAEYGWDAWVVSGSANATDAAFNRNIEFQVALHGKKSSVGIDAFLSQEKNQVRFADMLTEFRPDKEKPERDLEQEVLDREADRLCRLVANLQLVAEAKKRDDEDAFDLALIISSQDIPLVPSNMTVACWPITLAQAQSQSFEIAAGAKAAFDKISFEALTSFFAFEIVATKNGKTARRRFVVNALTRGFPQDRSERILRSLIKGADDLLRLILLILGENGTWEERLRAAVCLDREGWSKTGFEANGLFESLVKSLASQPWKLDHINRIITDLRGSEEGNRIIPAGFEAIWDPIWESRKALPNE